ncbi:GtrA family protein [Intrasporangium sp. YIM S08009]|uniref:GtrA family protein n=1 Tax=Intrasporangium zincisolvens TaxID=3080018 RepID=UPI002B06136D|nr:GtrA family protein [Intrasporangium sp. YIM S08009]
MKALIREHLGPLVRFSIVGVLNTGVYYGVYLLLVGLMPYLVAHLIGWFVAMTFSFLMNCRFTYHVRPTWRRYALFPVSNLPNVLATSVGVVALVELAHVSERLAPLIAGICAIPFSYLLGKVLMVKAHRDDIESPEALSTMGTVRDDG